MLHLVLVALCILGFRGALEGDIRSHQQMMALSHIVGVKVYTFVLLVLNECIYLLMPAIPTFPSTPKNMQALTPREQFKHPKFWCRSSSRTRYLSPVQILTHFLSVASVLLLAEDNHLSWPTCLFLFHKCKETWLC